MAPPVSERPRAARILALLEAYPGRLEFAARLALVCAATTLMTAFYRTPEPALTAYLAFFVVKPDRTSSVVISVIMVLLISFVVGGILLVTMGVLEQPLWRVTAMALISFVLLFAASASKLKPVAGIVALIAAFALDKMGSIQVGELATRALLYVWLLVAIPAGVSIAVNLLLGPSPRRLATAAMAHRLSLCAEALRAPEGPARDALADVVREGPGEIPAWLRLAGVEKTSTPAALAALNQALASTFSIMALTQAAVRAQDPQTLGPLRQRIAAPLDQMAAILRSGAYPVETRERGGQALAALPPLADAILGALNEIIDTFAEPPPPVAPAAPAAHAKAGFFVADAFTNPVHVHYALKTTLAAIFCYLTYSLLNWPGIHTCLITCYIVSLGTMAETMEKLTLRVLGCLIGAALGIAAIVFVMPSVTDIGVLMLVVFAAALLAGWIAAGSPHISYVGFQLAFAFFLCVIQGAGPGFDLTIARDRVVGILFGDLVVVAVFTLLWVETVAKRIDPEISAILRRLSAGDGAASGAGRLSAALAAQTALAGLHQDLELSRYEPGSIRPSRDWLDRRQTAAQAMADLATAMLLAGQGDPLGLSDVRRRLARLADRLTGENPDDTVLASTAAGTPRPAGAAQTPREVIDTQLHILERALAQPAEAQAKGLGYALA